MALVGGVVYVKELSLAIVPVLLYFVLLGVPGIPGTAAILSGSAPLRTWDEVSIGLDVAARFRACSNTPSCRSSDSELFDPAGH